MNHYTDEGLVRFHARIVRNHASAVEALRRDYPRGHAWAEQRIVEHAIDAMKLAQGIVSLDPRYRSKS